MTSLAQPACIPELQGDACYRTLAINTKYCFLFYCARWDPKVRTNRELPEMFVT